jgi:coenzyme F420-0:L-glutamate ligase
MQVQPIKTKVFKEGDDLIEFILEYCPKMKEQSILVVTSKIVALGEGRTVKFKNKKEKIKFIKKESAFAIKTKLVWLTIRDGMVMASAGIDESNADGKSIMLPKDSYRSAEFIRKEIGKKLKIKKLGVLITDSRIFPLRAGVVGGAIGYAGFKGIKNYVGQKDIFGRVLKYSKTNVADGLATAAVLCMGEGKEQRPLALISGAPVQFVGKINKQEIRINTQADIFYPLLKNIKIKKLPHGKKK